MAWRATVAFVGFRLNITSGSSRETDKWRTAFASLGFDSYVVAGNWAPGLLTVPGLAQESYSPPPVDIGCLVEALRPADLVVVDNMFSVAYNPAATRALAMARYRQPTILRHHDLAWHQSGTRNRTWQIPDDPAWVPTTINRRNQVELLRHGIRAQLVANAFVSPDLSEVDANRLQVRHVLGLEDGDALLLQPTRAASRKNLLGGLNFAGQPARHK